MDRLKEVCWGIIGVGNVCEVKSAPAMSLIKNSRLVAVMRRDGEKAQDYARRHGVPKWYDNADLLINDPEVNAIYIATPPDSHEIYTKKAAKAGKPVYVEKPMARTYAECLSMIAACSEADVPLFPAYYRRMLPNFLKIKSLIDERVVGDIRYVNILLNQTINKDLVETGDNTGNWRVFPEISGGGYFYDLASHQLDLMDFFFGPIESAHGLSVNQADIYPAEDIVTGTFGFENGIVGMGMWCFTTSEVSEKELITIVGSKGQISFSCFGDFSVTLELDGRKKEVMYFETPKHIQQALIQTIVDELLGSGKCPSTGISGARTNKVMELLSNKR